MRLTDDALFQCPYLHMEDVGTVAFSDAEVEALREYLLKGGFLWVDDYWGATRGISGCSEIGRVLPPDEYPDPDLHAGASDLSQRSSRSRSCRRFPSIQSWRGNPLRHLRARRGQRRCRTSAASPTRTAT